VKLLFYDSEIPEFLKNSRKTLGGACVRQYAIAQGLVANGCQVGILTWKGAKEYVGKNNLQFDLVESFPRNKGIKVLRAFYLWMPLLYKAVNSYKPDYLFQKGAAPITFMIGVISRLSGTRFVYLATSNKDGDNQLATVRNRFSRNLYYMGLKMAEAIVCQNGYQEETFKKMFPNKKVILMLNPFFSETELKPVKPLSERKYFAWIGNYRTVKNLPAVYDIAKSLPQYQFKVAGAIASEKNFGIEARIAVEKLEQCDNVELVGFLKREQIIPLLADAYVLFNTSHMEGFSNTFLESFAAGTPIVTREEIDPDGLIAGNKLGRIVKYNEEIPEALISLAEDSSFDEMSIRCQKYLTDHHSANSITNKFLQDLVEIS